ncbi:ribonuclease H [Senna tora]|uniref:Ribonuclease H n=1 Tax=Senna tora TaxID=362788 RepID=A0A834SU16_9FABA|nr:ribonuclease H [Senna tora]
MNNEDIQVNRVSDLIDGNHRWKRELVGRLYDTTTAGEILKIPISINQGEDKLYWSGNNDGVYKVKDGYTKLAKSSQPLPHQNSFKAWKEFWKINLPSKVLMFGWKLCHNRLPITENLLKRNYKIDGNCVFGCDLMETQSHLFMECPAAKASGHRVPIVGMVAPSEEQLQGTVLKGIRETLQMLRNYQYRDVTIHMDNKYLAAKLNGHTNFSNYWGTVARDIDTMRLDFTYFQYITVDYIDKAPLDYLRGAQPDDKYEFSEPTRIQGLVKNYSQFVSFPIYTWQEKSRTVDVLPWMFLFTLDVFAPFGITLNLSRMLSVIVEPRDMNCYKINVDGSIRDGGVAFASGVLWDSSGTLLKGFSFNIGICSAIEAKLWGFLRRLEVAWNHGCRKDFGVVEEELTSSLDLAIHARWVVALGFAA